MAWPSSRTAAYGRATTREADEEEGGGGGGAGDGAFDPRGRPVSRAIDFDAAGGRPGGAPGGARRLMAGGPVAGGYGAALRPPPGRGGINTHEILKHEIFAEKAATCDDHFDKSRPCPSAVYGVSDQYVVLDSFEKVEDSRPERGRFCFNFMVGGVTRDQTIGVNARLDTVIGVQVCAFCIPLLPFEEFDPARLQLLDPSLPANFLTANGPFPTAGTAVTNPQSQTPFCGRVTMFLKELGGQSYSDADNRRHHFEFEATVAGPGEDGPPPVVGDRILLTPLDDGEFFLFTAPIQTVGGLTVCFYNPGAELRFPPDTLYGATASADGGGYLTFAYTDMTNLVNLAEGDRVQILGFTSGRPTLDTYVNRPAGHLVGPPVATTPPSSPTSGTRLSFRLNPNVDVTTLTPPFSPSAPILSSTRIVVRIAKNRIRIPLRFRCVLNRLTNYVAP